MKNITVSVPDEVYRRAKVRAAEQGRSLSALVAEFLGLIVTFIGPTLTLQLIRQAWPNADFRGCEL